MNYDVVEDLAARAKLGDNDAKEKLVLNFNPLIFNISKKSFINSYEFSDIKNECYLTLFKCLRVYDADRHCFVGYATNAIKNSVNNLIKVSVRRDTSEGQSAFILDGDLEKVLSADGAQGLEDLILSKLDIASLKLAIGALTYSEQELVTYLFFNNYTLRNYSALKGMPYNTVVYLKKNVLQKIKTFLKFPPKNNYIN